MLRNILFVSVFCAWPTIPSMPLFTEWNYGGKGSLILKLEVLVHNDFNNSDMSEKTSGRSWEFKPCRGNCPVCPLNVIMAVLRQQHAVLLLTLLHYLDLHLPGVREQHRLLVMNTPTLPAASNNSVNMTWTTHEMVWKIKPVSETRCRPSHLG